VCVPAAAGQVFAKRFEHASQVTGETPAADI